MNIAIAGYGIEGKASYKYWNMPEHELTIVDERESIDDVPEGARTLLGPGVFTQLQGFDLVVRTASLPPKKIMTDGKIWSATNEFFAMCPAPIIGVTGTKGKGTTASLVASILRAAGKMIHLVGNIGTSALEALPQIKADDIVVFELSSFQLWDIKKSPQVAVVLMIEPDHLDIHENFEEYVEAKANIRRFQGTDDICIYHPTNELSHKIALSNESAGPMVRFGVPDDGQVYVSENTFFVQDQAICTTHAVQLPGAHNLENACAAISAARIFTIDNDAIERGLRSFTGLPHRLEYAATVNGVKYYDDSFSSATPATKVAVSSFEAPVVLIMGGYDRGIEYADFARDLATRPNLKHVITLGQTGPKLAALLKENGYQSVTEVTSLKSAVEAAREVSVPGDVVVLSPGCASFDMFKDFTDRGEQFQQEVRSL